MRACAEHTSECLLGSGVLVGRVWCYTGQNGGRVWVGRRRRRSSEGGGVWCRGLESIPFMKLTASVHQRAVRPPKFAKNRCCRSANRRKIGHSCTMFSLLSRAPLITFVHRHEDRLSRVSTWGGQEFREIRVTKFAMLSIFPLREISCEI